MKKLSALLVLFMLVGCSNGGSGDSLTKDANVKEAIDAAYATVEETNQIPTMDMDKETIINFFGLDENKVEDAFGKGPMMSAHIDMIVGIKATKGNVEAVEDVIETYQDNLEEDTMQYPSNLAAIQNAEVFTAGNTVYYVRLNTYTQDLNEDQMAEEIEKINDKAEDAIKALHK